MDSIHVQGGIALQGKVRIQGSKNAALPILAASLMAEGQVTLENVPKIADVYGMLHILTDLGCGIRWERDSVTIDPAGAQLGHVSGESATSMRSSIFLLGATLAREGRAVLTHPGGCVIGKRPIDLHLKALARMGVSFEERDGLLWAMAEQGLKPAQIELDFPSVGATENVIMAATAAMGITRVTGAAREPEVQALCQFLQAAGASVEGAGTSELVIEGGRPLKGIRFSVPSDRIVAGTYLFAGFTAGGSMLLENAPVMHLEAVLNVAEKMGAGITLTEDGVYAQFPERAKRLPSLTTAVYPGFPTDLQSVILAASCIGKGKTLIRETIFENRFRIVEDLRRMGACVEVLDEKNVLVRGAERLFGARVEARELRGGAALVVAALGAEGETVITGRKYIDRGYENICRDFRELGARIVSE